VTQSGFGQGYGEETGLGILYDLGGDDFYKFENLTGGIFEGLDGQGGGKHTQGIGMLLDDTDGSSSNDIYNGSRFVQGWAADQSGAAYQSRGYFLDNIGNDIYIAAYNCQGWAGDANATFSDEGGGTDSYTCSQATSFGSRGDGHTWASGNTGVGKDT
jgi:hypothetical protein